jgi:hypothetical protein
MVPERGGEDVQLALRENIVRIRYADGMLREVERR